ncbi:glycosyltransferase family 2 protein [Xanthomonas hydrangeae]|uniref:Glycosyltransferase family 2 protein n=1 Tax=Xanthomonas hydrangeae TaxID=2775159 RepID=A0AAU0B7G3_9XANT|nr:glycosyltransferase family 2 protein [Xanthomonas hydrangeae]WOB48109.1 glycosyltransferase family 2 protein [Xanthomonas hydrangeae]
MADIMPPASVSVWRCVPIANIASAGEPDLWEAVDGDPQFRITPSNLPIQSGWYRLRASFREIEGRLRAPCFYPDYGQGISEQTRIDIGVLIASGQLDALVHFPEPVHALRFDPCEGRARFVLSEVHATAVSEKEALWLMQLACLSALNDATPSKMLAITDTVRHHLNIAGHAEALLHLIPHYASVNLADRHLYATWTIRADRQINEMLDQALPVRASSEAQPPFSFLLPDEPVEFEACVASLFAQRFADFELLLSSHQVDSLSRVVELYDDQRVRVIVAPNNLRERIGQARGTFLCLLSANDRLHNCATGILAAAFAKCPNALAFYYDEDLIDPHGVRSQPFFKPAWDPVRFLEQDYLGHSVAIRRNAFGPFCDLDPALPWLNACINAVGDAELSRVVHVPHVLMHHCGKPGAISSPFGAQGVAVDHARLLNLRFAERVGAEVVQIMPDRLRASHPSPGRPMVDIIIPTRDRVDLLSVCIDSLLSMTLYENYRVTVVDNGSELAESIAYFGAIVEDPRVRVLAYNQPFNYSAINNHAVSQCDGDIVLLLNNDIEVVDGSWLEEMVGLAMRPDVGAVGAKLFYPDMTLQHAGVVLGVGGVAAHALAHASADFAGPYGQALLLQQYSAVTAACLAIRRDLYLAVSGLDETIAVAFNDVDFCLRVQRAGYRNVWTPHASLIHHESASRGIEDDPVKQARFASEVKTMLERWFAVLDSDPAYSPNLSLIGAAGVVDPERHAPDVIRQA